MPNRRVVPEERICRVCGSTFLCGGVGRKPRRQVYCSNRCSVRDHPAVIGRTWKTTTLPTVAPSLLDIAWAAGIYEGEGTSRAHGNSTAVAVSQKDRWLLERLVVFFGGSINGPAKSGVSEWRAYGRLARAFLEAVYPLLSPRRQAQADRALVRNVA